MKRFLSILIFTLVVVGFGVFVQRSVFAVDCQGDEQCKTLQAEIDKIQSDLSASVNATKPLEAQVSSLDSRIKAAQISINVAKAQAVALAKSIEEREATLADKYIVFSERVRASYQRSRTFNPLVILLSSKSASEFTHEMAYRRSIEQNDKNAIKEIGTDIVTLEADKKKLEERQVQLASLQKQLDAQAETFRKDIAGAKSYQATLQGKIASLSSQQQAIISARSGSYITGVGSVPIGSDFDGSIAGFQQNAPSGSFAVFAFGAYTHRKGMSQYGAKARANENQNYKTILSAYYGKEPTNKDTGGDISVSGYGNINFEEKYLYGIAEMPSDWPMEALKAQAVAARTFAYRYKKDGTTICTTEACQVFSKSKADNPPENWKKAVDETRGQVIEDVVTFYSSTSGGYLTTSGWDTTDKNGGGDWTSRAWESKAGSPWFYKAWYRQAYQNSSSDCGRKPWLSEEEMADIINAWLVRKDANGADTARIIPVTIGSCAVGGQSGSPYSMSELRGFVSNPVTSISGKPVVSNNNDGQTTSVVFQTNRGSVNIPGSEFKETFNTRAPGYISIPQSGFAFFNIERK